MENHSEQTKHLQPSEIAAIFHCYHNCNMEITCKNNVDTLTGKYYFEGRDSVRIAGIVNNFDGTGQPAKLLLKSLGEISDQDAYNIGVLLNPLPTYGNPKKVGQDIAKHILEPNSTYAYNYLMAQKITDFLRSHGYALPYMQWSVEELVEFGIFKIIKRYL